MMMSFVSFSSLDPLGIGNILCDRYVECKKWRATNKKKKKKKSFEESHRRIPWKVRFLSNDQRPRSAH